MKATERSQKAADLIAEIKRKLDARDETPLGDFVAIHVSNVVGDAEARESQDDETLRYVEDALDRALKLLTQYEVMRDRQSGTDDP